MIPAQRIADPGPRTGAALWALGFRPFYLLAAALAALWVPLWLARLAGVPMLDPVFDGVAWHAHEMLYGFTAAVLVGFLYTAVPNWTGRPTPRGAALAALCGLWLAGRLALLAGGGWPGWLVAALDVAFLPLAALGLLPPLVATRNRRNIAFPFVLMALGLGNLVMHLDRLGVPGLAGLAAQVLPFAFAAITLILVVMAGRVIPFFTQNALPAAGVRRHARLDDGATAAAALALAAGFTPYDRWAGGLALAAAALLVARALPWRPRATRGTPMLWILHAGHGWIAVFFALDGLGRLGLGIPAGSAVHALTVGAIGALMLGMMARSALGHTGRRIVAGPLLVTVFVLINAAAVVRVLGPLLPEAALAALHLSGALWTAAYALFLVRFVPILTRPRADGRPG